MNKKVYKVEGMDCDACAKMIELDLEDEGIVAKCDYAKASLEVEESAADTEEKIVKILKKSGYKITPQDKR
jgi:copper chaperone CopZ